ncbi:hypothetical protein KSP40_PGU016357 [Platanthera guangdongensis]|uniref:Uncharacterized protein n=1 Tax=Platanthera guangdongensis TaxID=2320717 RepID=A0ABR2LQF0_9ASPA
MATLLLRALSRSSLTRSRSRHLAYSPLLQSRTFAVPATVADEEVETIIFPRPDFTFDVCGYTNRREGPGMSYGLNWALAGRGVIVKDKAYYNLKLPELKKLGARKKETSAGFTLYLRGNTTEGNPDISKAQFGKLLKQVLDSEIAAILALKLPPCTVGLVGVVRQEASLSKSAGGVEFQEQKCRGGIVKGLGWRVQELYGEEVGGTYTGARLAETVEQPRQTEERQAATSREVANSREIANSEQANQQQLREVAARTQLLAKVAAKRCRRSSSERTTSVEGRRTTKICGKPEQRAAAGIKNRARRV